MFQLANFISTFMGICLGFFISTLMRDYKAEKISKLIKNTVGRIYNNNEEYRLMISNKLKLLQDNAFADRAKILELENKLERLERK